MELVFLCLVFTMLVADQGASAKETETIISAGNWVPVNSFDVGSGTYNRWVVSVYACIESFTDLVSLISDIWLLW